MTTSSPTPNMGLLLPIPQVTLGPEYAADNTAAFTLVDSHDHTPGHGALITPTAILINSKLDFHTNPINNVTTIRFVAFTGTQSGSLDVNSLYSVNGDMYWNNSAGFPVKVTNGNVVNGGGGGGSSSGSMAAGYTLLVSYPYTVQTSDAGFVLGVNTVSARTINLPAASSGVITFALKDIGFNAATNNITIVPDGSDLLENINANYIYAATGGSITLISDGSSKWYII